MPNLSLTSRVATSAKHAGPRALAGVAAETAAVPEPTGSCFESRVASMRDHDRATGAQGALRRFNDKLFYCIRGGNLQKVCRLYHRVILTHRPAQPNAETYALLVYAFGTPPETSLAQSLDRRHRLYRVLMRNYPAMNVQEPERTLEEPGQMLFPPPPVKAFAQVVEAMFSVGDSRGAARFYSAVSDEAGNLPQHIVAGTANAMLKGMMTLSRHQAGSEEGHAGSSSVMQSGVLDVLQHMRVRKICPTSSIVALVVDALVSEGRGEAAKLLLRRLKATFSQLPVKRMLKYVDRLTQSSGGMSVNPGSLLELVENGSKDFDVVSLSSSVHRLARRNDVEGALKVLKTMRKHDMRRNVAIYSAILSAFSRRLEAKRAYEFFQEMEYDGVQPNFVCYTALLTALAKTKRVNKESAMSKEDILYAAESVWRKFEESSAFASADIASYTSMLSIRFRWDSVQAGLALWDRLLERQSPIPDLYMYTLVITGVLSADNVAPAIPKERRLDMACKLEHDMRSRGIEPDRHLTSILERAFRGNRRLQKPRPRHQSKV